MSTTPATDQLLSAFSPWLAYDLSGNLATYLRALGSMFDAVAVIVQDQGDPDDANYVPGWSNLLDPDACPTALLPFLSQFNGTGVQPGTPDAEARAIIKAESGFKRGSPASIISAVQRNLVGTQSCFLLERAPNAYGFQVVVRPEEVVSATAITDAVNAVKPAGLTWQLIQTDSFIWNQALHTFSGDVLSWNATASTQP